MSILLSIPLHLIKYNFKYLNGMKSIFPMSRRSQPSSDLAVFRDILKKSSNIVVLTGAGVSAESGVPTFRGAGGFWRKYVAQDLATPEAFTRNPSLVWEFYHYRRELVLTKQPNRAHEALAECESRLKREGKNFLLITQNIDGLHLKAGSQEVLELHGSLFKTRCLKCGRVAENRDSPICPALKEKGAPEPEVKDSCVSVEDLPHCSETNCHGLLRPHVVWFGEGVDQKILIKAGKALENCDLCLVIGTSSVIYPAAMFAPQVAARGIPVAEFNIEATPATYDFKFHFEGPCGSTVPEALSL